MILEAEVLAFNYEWYSLDFRGLRTEAKGSNKFSLKHRTLDKITPSLTLEAYEITIFQAMILALLEQEFWVGKLNDLILTSITSSKFGIIPSRRNST